MVSGGISGGIRMPAADGRSPGATAGQQRGLVEGRRGPRIAQRCVASSSATRASNLRAPSLSPSQGMPGCRGDGDTDHCRASGRVLARTPVDCCKDLVRLRSPRQLYAERGNQLVPSRLGAPHVLKRRADEMEQQLPAGLGEGEIAEFVEDDEVEAREIIGEPSLAASARMSLELID